MTLSEHPGDFLRDPRQQGSKWTCVARVWRGEGGFMQGGFIWSHCWLNDQLWSPGKNVCDGVT